MSMPSAMVRSRKRTMRVSADASPLWLVLPETCSLSQESPADVPTVFSDEGPSADGTQAATQGSAVGP